MRSRDDMAARPSLELRASSALIPRGRPNGRGMWDQTSEFLFRYAVAADAPGD
jgi:hypothetical protein